MINLCLYGGLGNQIFQLAASLKYAKTKNIKTINIDTSIINRFDTKFGFQLDELFSFKDSIIEFNFNNHFYSNLRLPKISFIRYFSNEILISDNNFQAALNSHKNNHFYQFDGYFQECLTQSDLDSMIELLRPLLRLNLNNSINKNKNKDNLVIHIRGGDFVKLNRNPELDENFYLNKIKNFDKSKKIKVVTDDIKYSKKILSNIDRDYEIVSSTMLNDFITIASHSNRILSPSTFSFWASALGYNFIESRVYAWQYWYDHVPREIYLPNEKD